MKIKGITISNLIAEMDDRIESIPGCENEILRASGWEYTCNHPANLWLWVRGEYKVDTATALAMVRAEEAQAVESALGVEPDSDTNLDTVNRARDEMGGN